MIAHSRIVRVLHDLMRNQGVPPDAIERSVESACNMTIGDQGSLTGEPEDILLRAFAIEQTNRLDNA